MAMFDTSQIEGSIDTIEIAHNYDWLPSEEELIERGFKARRGKFYGTKKWSYDVESTDYEPRITIYPVWGGRGGRVRVGASLPKLLYGHNVENIDACGVCDALAILERLVVERLGIPFDVITALVQRIDYAMILCLTVEEARSLFKHFSNYRVSYFTRETKSSESESIYFRNKSRQIALYDKRGELLHNEPNRIDLHEMAKGVIRVELRYLNEKTIIRYIPKFGIEKHTVAALVTPNQVRKATEEMIRLLRLKQLDLSSAIGIRTIVDRLNGDMKTAITLRGFQEAVKEYGQDFYRDPAHEYSKSTYDRNRRLIQQLGLPLSV